jgi:hypothetical protein
MSGQVPAAPDLGGSTASLPSLRSVPTMQQRLTLLLNHEIAAVETAMRSPSKWAVVPRYYVSRASGGR